MKAYTKLLGLDYKIVYKKGTENSAADALSRLPTATHAVPGDLYALSTSQNTWMQQLTTTYDQHLATTKLLSSLVITSPQGHFTLDAGVIKYKTRIWVASSTTLQHQIIHALHSSAIGFLVTYMKVKKRFA